MSLIDFGNLTEPAKVFVERVSDLIGGALRPSQIRRIASAEADAKMMTTVADLQAETLRRRTAQRWLAEEEEKQMNMETIASAALPQITENAQPNKIERDWLVNFFDKARLTSDEGMQAMWAKILAGEANTPGKFGKRTVNLMASLDKNDAQLFQTLCRFSWSQPVGHRPVIFDYQDKVYTDHGLNFDTLKHLDEIGLATFNAMTGFRLQFSPSPRPVNENPFPVQFSYFDEKFVGILNEVTTNLDMGQLMLSKVGIELSEICAKDPVDGFSTYCLNYWRARGVKSFERRS